MDTRERLVRHIARAGGASGRELREALGITRQALHLHLRRLIAEGAIEKTGSTRNAAYVPPGARGRAPAYRRSFALRGLQEDKVYDDIALRLRLKKELPESVRRIVYYAFTEMLNNAIDHSRAQACTVEFGLGPYDVRFAVRDRGIGVFHSIASRFGLRGEREALGELIKGKTTTMKERHSGEGIFFTAKAADALVLRSHGTELEFQTLEDDLVVREKRHIEGTEVRFALSRRSKRRLEDVFAKHAPPEFDYRFERTSVRVDLFGDEYVSRSEARRLLGRLESFREIELDFRNVRSLGRAFADEIFRVFRRRHPGVSVRWVHASAPIEALLRQALDN
jgi:anti-sigma regulatory factor (Ser/Thr protein kinase)